MPAPLLWVLLKVLLRDFTKLSKSAFTCSKLTIQTLEQGVKHVKVNNKDAGVFIVNFEHIPHLVIVFLLLTLRK